ncbi:MAG: DNA-binding response regulator [Planctomycetota bacterium]|nr:MAG: DNA-binding response regulator [Planctomycetota bacterium]RLS96869.1 MAG: DNA-binding response regulator [Planctomycetota bacterium]
MSTSKPRVMVVEDDPAIRAGLCDVLRFGGYVPLSCARGDTAVAEILASLPDLVLLDVMLPGGDGFAILRAVRTIHASMPIVMVTARGDEVDRIDGLEHGADDYVVKPFNARELLARVGAVLRRSAERPASVHTITLGNAMVDLARCEARFIDSTNVKCATLSAREAEVLRVLASNRTRVISREELLRVVWAVDPRGAETRAVDMQMVRLRESLAAVGLDALIETVRSKGYRLAAHAEVRP